MNPKDTTIKAIENYARSKFGDAVVDSIIAQNGKITASDITRLRKESTNLPIGFLAAVDSGSSVKCECGTDKTYANEPNKEYLHSDWCPLFMSPFWVSNLKDQLLKEKK